MVLIWEDGCVWLVGTSCDSFPKRIESDGRCALGFVDFDLSRGVLQHVGMRGFATVVPLDKERLHRLLSRYLGPEPETWNPQFKQRVIEPLDLMVRFEPATTVIRDQSYFK